MANRFWPEPSSHRNYRNLYTAKRASRFPYPSASHWPVVDDYPLTASLRRRYVRSLYVAIAVLAVLVVMCACTPLSVELLPGRYDIEALRRQARYQYNGHPEIIRYGTYSNRSIDGWVVDCNLGGPFIVSEIFAFCTDDFGLTVTGFDPAEGWSISNIDITAGSLLGSQGGPDGTPPQAHPSLNHFHLTQSSASPQAE